MDTAYAAFLLWTSSSTNMDSKYVQVYILQQLTVYDLFPFLLWILLHHTSSVKLLLFNNSYVKSELLVTWLLY